MCKWIVSMKVGSKLCDKVRTPEDETPPPHTLLAFARVTEIASPSNIPVGEVQSELWALDQLRPSLL